MSGVRLARLSLRHYDAILLYRVFRRNNTRRPEEGTRACEKSRRKREETKAAHRDAITRNPQSSVDPSKDVEEED